MLIITSNSTWDWEDSLWSRPLREEGSIPALLQATLQNQNVGLDGEDTQNRNSVSYFRGFSCQFSGVTPNCTQE